MKKKPNKSQAIRKLIDAGLDNNQIRRRLKVSNQLVYIVRQNHSSTVPLTKLHGKDPVMRALLVASRAIDRALVLMTKRLSK